MNIILCGYKSCGKSTIAKAYSQYYTCQCIDTDDLIIEKWNALYGEKRTIAQIYNVLGELKFRQLEEMVIKKLNNVEDAIIATGGGAVMCQENVKNLKLLGKIIYLQVEQDELYRRLLKLEYRPAFIEEGNDSPLFSRRGDGIEENLLTESSLDQVVKRWEAYFSKRQAIYRAISDHMINITSKTTAQVISMIDQYRCQHGE